VIGPFSNDFLGGLCLGLACALVGALVTFVLMLYRDRRPLHPVERVAPTPVDMPPVIVPDSPAELFR
jgi:hypothetical protein